MDHLLSNNQDKTIFEVDSDEENDVFLNNLNLIIPISRRSKCGSNQRVIFVYK